MNIDDMTIGNFKEISKLLNSNKEPKTLNQQIGEKVIIRTYSAGVWFGTLSEKSGNEVILNEARRMFFWAAKESISLSGVAKHGINYDKSKICPRVEKVWLEAIEILTLTDICINSLEHAKDVEAE